MALPALTISGLTIAAAPATAAPDPTSAQVQGGARWLKAQLTGGIVHNNAFNFDDVGLSADIAFALRALGDDAAADNITDAIEPLADTNWYRFTGSPDTYAGSLAKALVLAQAAGSSVTDFGGQNLPVLLEGRVATAAPIDGRIQDETSFPDSANVVGQAYAAQGLAAAGSDRAADATDFLLAQQCAEGFFRLNFNPDKTEAGQSCDTGAPDESPADPDATALVVLALQAQAADPDVEAALDDAVAWLLDAQNADGSFNGGTSTDVPNSNSTGLAGQALGVVGEEDAAVAAADWVADQQSTRLGNCSSSGLAGETGAIAYDPDAFDEGHRDGITPGAEDQWRRATAQALPALQWVTDPQTVGDATVGAPDGFVRGSSEQAITVEGLATGERACLQGNGVAEIVRGGAPTEVQMKVAGKTGTYTYKLVRLGDQPRDTMTVLGELKVPFALKRSVAKGDEQVVRVTGLESGEQVRVKFRGEKVDAGEANANGKFTGRFKVTGARGEAPVQVVGQFITRRGNQTFTVTR